MADGTDEGVLSMLAGLLDVSHMVRFDELPRVVERFAAGAGLDGVAIYLTDLREQSLREMGARDRPRELAVEGTVAGRAFQLGEVVLAAEGADDPRRWWVPLLNGTERLGLLAVSAVRGDARERRHAELLASAVALVLVGRGSSSDDYPRMTRTEPMAVAAELRWQLMQPRTNADPQAVIGAVAEPAYRIGGDAFDYSRAEERVRLAVFDAMGHDLAAGLAANLAVTACRTFRRERLDLVETSSAIERVLIEQFGVSLFVTGILASLDLRTGVLTWVNRGHPPPIIIRDGRWTIPIACPPAPPMGTGLGRGPRLCRNEMRPGDRVVMYTDGVTEARDSGGREFGFGRFLDFLARHHDEGLPVPETLRRLTRGIMEHLDGPFTDDATVLVAEWIGAEDPPPHRPDRLAGLPDDDGGAPDPGSGKDGHSGLEARGSV